MAERRLRGFNFSGKPIYWPTDEELARPQPRTEEFDCIETLSDGRMVTQTGYDPETGKYSYHEVDYANNILWDKPIEQETIDREYADQ